MKCPICENEKFIRYPVRFEHWYEDAVRENCQIETVMCQNCGHIEFIDKKYCEFLKERLKDNNCFFEKVMNFFNEVENLVKTSECRSLVDVINDGKAQVTEQTTERVNKIQDLVCRSESLDITIRERNDILKEIEELKKDLEDLKNKKILLDKKDENINGFINAVKIFFDEVDCAKDSECDISLRFNERFNMLKKSWNSWQNNFKK